MILALAISSALAQEPTDPRRLHIVVPMRSELAVTWSGDGRTPVMLAPPGADVPWSLSKGTQPLDVVAFHELTGQPAVATELQGRIERATQNAKGWASVGALGLAGLITGFVGTEVSPSADSFRAWNSVLVSGAALTVVGVSGTVVLGTKARRLRWEPGYTVGFDQAVATVEQYNAGLD